MHSRIKRKICFLPHQKIKFEWPFRPSEMVSLFTNHVGWNSTYTLLCMVNVLRGSFKNLACCTHINFEIQMGVRLNFSARHFLSMMTLLWAINWHFDQFFFDHQLWPLIFLQPLDQNECLLPHIWVEAEVRGHDMTFKDFGSK